MSLGNAANFLGQTLHSTTAPERIAVVDQNETVDQSSGPTFEHRDTIYADDHLTGTLMTRAELSANTLTFYSTAPVRDLGSTTNPWDTTRTRTLGLQGATSGVLSHTVPAVVTDHTLTWPAVQGGAGTQLQNDGAGNLSWAAGSAITGTGAATQVVFWTGATTVAGDAGLTYASATDLLTITQAVAGTGGVVVTNASGAIRLGVTSVGRGELLTTTMDGMDIGANGTLFWRFQTDGAFVPLMNDSYTIGTTSAAVATTFTNIVRAGATTTLQLQRQDGQVWATLDAGIDVTVIDLSTRWNDDIELRFGTGNNARFIYDTGQTNDALQLVLDPTNNTLMIVRDGNQGQNQALANQANPTVFIFSATAGLSTEHLTLAHDGTNAQLDTGTGTVSIAATTGGVSFRAIDYIFPAALGASGAVLTDVAGNGTVTWVVPSAGGAQIGGTPADNEIAVWTNSTTIEGDGNFSWERGGAVFIARTDSNFRGQMRWNARSGLLDFTSTIRTRTFQIDLDYDGTVPTVSNTFRIFGTNNDWNITTFGSPVFKIETGGFFDLSPPGDLSAILGDKWIRVYPDNAFTRTTSGNLAIVDVVNASNSPGANFTRLSSGTAFVHAFGVGMDFTLNVDTSLQSGGGFYAYGADITHVAGSEEFGFLRFLEAGTVRFRIDSDGDALIRNVDYTWPAASGAAGSVLTDAAGNGTLTWAVSSGVTGSGVINRIAVWSAASAITSTAGFEFDGTDLTIPNGMNAGGSANPGTGDGIFIGGMVVGFDATPGAGGQVEIGDADHSLQFNSGAPRWVVDGNDLVGFNRSTNRWTFEIGGVVKFTVDNAAIVGNEAGADVDHRLEGDTLSHMLFLEGDAASENIALLAASLPSWGGMDRGMFIGNATTVPTSNPTAGGFLYVEGGALKWRGSSGAITTLGAA